MLGCSAQSGGEALFGADEQIIPKTIVQGVTPLVFWMYWWQLSEETSDLCCHSSTLWCSNNDFSKNKKNKKKRQSLSFGTGRFLSDVEHLCTALEQREGKCLGSEIQLHVPQRSSWNLTETTPLCCCFQGDQGWHYVALPWTCHIKELMFRIKYLWLQYYYSIINFHLG